ncbi:MAG: hypothetical protein WCK88_03955 [bacterium]
MKETASGEVQNIEEMRRTNNLTAKNIPPPATSTINIINPNADISRYNPRDADTLKLSGK